MYNFENINCIDLIAGTTLHGAKAVGRLPIGSYVEVDASSVLLENSRFLRSYTCSIPVLVNHDLHEMTPLLCLLARQFCVSVPITHSLSRVRRANSWTTTHWLPVNQWHFPPRHKRLKQNRLLCSILLKYALWKGEHCITDSNFRWLRRKGLSHMLTV